MTATHAADVAVIGAGPAGLSAALAAAECGAVVHLIDAAPAAGGGYWMQRAPALDAHPRASQMAEGAAAIAAVHAAGVTVHAGAEVWGVFPDRRIVATTGGEPLEIAARAIVVATGAYDRVPAFPGWTLPGVITAGAAQRLAKLGNVAAGARVVVAGSGPFLPVVAAALRGTGATIAAFVEAQRPGLDLVAHVARFPERWGETLRVLRASAPAERVRFGWIVTDALGAERVEAVRIAPIARDGTIDRARATTLAPVDALVTGWGFRPSIDVTSLLGCEHAYDVAAGGWYCRADADTGSTSIAHVYAAGEVTGVAGALAARHAGTLAGIAAAADAGRRTVPAREHVDAIRRQLTRARAFVEPFNRRCAPPRAIDELAGDDTIVCRCERVTKAEIVAAYADGATGVLGAKLWTRAGMGRCQGRTCGWDVARLAGGGDPQRAGYNRPRIPIRPVALAAVAAAMNVANDEEASAS
jgi:NADPH-dependent 2,4-dienoyl-CoA reductase/sulfur reductase-like enzyme